MHISGFFVFVQFVPRGMVTLCDMYPGASITLEDCFSRMFNVVLEYWVGVNYLGHGWQQFLVNVQAKTGDSILFKFKGPRTCKVIVFGEGEGVQKFPCFDDNNRHLLIRGGKQGVARTQL